jgi:hypothetical protein
MDATSVRSILLRLALVIAVLAGLLAMHTLVTGPSHAAAATALTMEHHPAEPWGDPERGIDADDCGPECVPLHAMGVMACVLALLVGLSLVMAPRAESGSWKRPTAAHWLIGEPRSVVARPPSLVALSISRT